MRLSDLDQIVRLKQNLDSCASMLARIDRHQKAGNCLAVACSNSAFGDVVTLFHPLGDELLPEIIRLIERERTAARVALMALGVSLEDAPLPAADADTEVEADNTVGC